MFSAIFTGTLSFSAFAEGFATVITLYSLCKGQNTQAAKGIQESLHTFTERIQEVENNDGI